MKKKLMCMLLTGVVTASMLAGCGSENETAGADDAVAVTDDAAAVTDDAVTDTADATDAEDNTADTTGDFDTSEYVSVYSREDGSGTRTAFIELFGVEEKDENGEKIDYTTEEAIVTNSTDVMLTSVAGDTYAIGYVSLGSLNDTVKAAKIDGAEATVDNIKSGTYKIARPFNIAVKEDVSDASQDFINFILSSFGQQVIEDAGYISTDDAPEFQSNGATGKVVVGGSSSVAPVMEKLIEAYKAAIPEADIELQSSDSTTGMTGAADGTLDIGMASRDLKDTEVEAGLTGIQIATDGIAVIVNQENPVENLSSEVVKGIFTGELQAWDEAE